MSTEAELKRKVQVTLFLWEDGCIDKTDEEIAKAIHTLYLQAGYVQLTRDEADTLIHAIDWIPTCVCTSCTHFREKHKVLFAKLRSRLEIDTNNAGGVE
jgi:hypothetical protein